MLPDLKVEPCEKEVEVLKPLDLPLPIVDPVSVDQSDNKTNFFSGLGLQQVAEEKREG